MGNSVLIRSTPRKKKINPQENIPAKNRKKISFVIVSEDPVSGMWVYGPFESNTEAEKYLIKHGFRMSEIDYNLCNIYLGNAITKARIKPITEPPAIK